VVPVRVAIHLKTSVLGLKTGPKQINDACDGKQENKIIALAVYFGLLMGDSCLHG